MFGQPTGNPPLPMRSNAAAVPRVQASQLEPPPMPLRARPSRVALTIRWLTAAVLTLATALAQAQTPPARTPSPTPAQVRALLEQRCTNSGCHGVAAVGRRVA